MHGGRASVVRMTTEEHDIFLPVPVTEAFDYLVNPKTMAALAPGIDEATMIGGDTEANGMTLGLRTRSGRELRAQVTQWWDDDSWTAVDENDTVLRVQLEAAGTGTLVHATLAGNWSAHDAPRIAADFHARADALGSSAPPRPASSHSV